MQKFFIAILAMLFFYVPIGAQEFDFEIPAIEKETTYPSSYDLQQGNYAVEMMNIPAFEKQIEASLNGDIMFHIVDTGVDEDHYLLANMIRMDLSKSYTGEPINDLNSHGTHVLGCAAAYSSTANYGTAGLLNKNNKAQAVIYKSLTNLGSGRFEWVKQALQQIREYKDQFPLHNHIVVMSLGSQSAVNSVAYEVKQAANEGILLFIAAGNNGGTPVSFPGRADGGTAIAALDQRGKRVYFSQYGKEVAFAAPGVAILASIPGGGVGKKSGTSMSTPLVAGFAALVWSMHPDATNNQILQAMAANTEDVTPPNRDAQTGFGLPVAGLWMFEDITTKYKDEPIGWLGDGDSDDDDDEPPTLPTREKRIVTFTFSDQSILWKRLNETELKVLEIPAFAVQLETDLYDKDAFTEVQKYINSFFKNRALVLRNEHGFRDATYYTAFFLEMLAKRADIPIEVTSMHGLYEEKRADYNTVVEFEDLHSRSWRKTKLNKQEKGVFSFTLKV